jgi:hypothetical protein
MAGRLLAPRGLSSVVFGHSSSMRVLSTAVLWMSAEDVPHVALRSPDTNSCSVVSMVLQVKATEWCGKARSYQKFNARLGMADLLVHAENTRAHSNAACRVVIVDEYASRMLRLRDCSGGATFLTELVGLRAARPPVGARVHRRPKKRRHAQIPGKAAFWCPARLQGHAACYQHGQA